MHKGEFLQLSTSDDGVHWQRPQVILGPRKEDAFDNWALVAPTLVRDQGQWLLFYSAFGASPAKRGEFLKQVGPFSLTARKWGIFVPQENRTIDVNLGRAASQAPSSHKTR